MVSSFFYLCLVVYCPFKEHQHRGDVRPSFRVFPDSDQCWYCYSWARGGDLFDFLCLYHGLTVQEGWARLQDGTLGEVSDVWLLTYHCQLSPKQ